MSAILPLGSLMSCQFNGFFLCGDSNFWSSWRWISWEVYSCNARAPNVFYWRFLAFWSSVSALLRIAGTRGCVPIWTYHFCERCSNPLFCCLNSCLCCSAVSFTWLLIYVLKSSMMTVLGTTTVFTGSLFLAGKFFFGFFGDTFPRLDSSFFSSGGVGSGSLSNYSFGSS